MSASDGRIKCKIIAAHWGMLIGRMMPHLPLAVGLDFLFSALLPIHQFDAGAHLLTQSKIIHSNHLTHKK